MRTFFKKLGIALLSLVMVSPMVDAQNHTSGNRGRNNSHTTATQRPSGNNSRPSAPARPNKSNNHNRPNNGNHNRPSTPARPTGGNNHNRPGNGNHHRPNVPDRPTGGHNHNRPGNGWHFGRPNWSQPPRPSRPPMMAPPMRPHRPRPSAWSRPVPPPYWRPRPSAPAISAILGISFGTTFNISIDYLLNNGYVVDGYGDNIVYLRDINQFNYYWPDATLYYGNGGLARSEFLYSTPYPDMVRYNSLYNSFMSVYGTPVGVSSSGATLTATWFAPNSGYITLRYSPQYALGGSLRYFTTLTFGL